MNATGGTNVAADRTKAIVVGVESYQAGSTWNLNGPASDAVRFLKYLHGCGVPKNNVYAYLAPLEANLGLLDEARSLAAETASPTLAVLNDLLEKNLPLEPCDMLLVYWSGHGFITNEHERLLFTADATPLVKRNIDLNSMLALLGSTSYPSVGRIDVIVDTCANYVAAGTAGLSRTTFAYGTGVAGRPQFVLCGASPGEYAKNIAGEQMGLFSRELLSILTAAASASAWPPDLTEAARELATRFSELRKHDRTVQTPAIVWVNGPSQTELADVPDADASDRFFRRLGAFRSGFSFLGCAAVNSDFGTRDVDERLKGLLENPSILSFDAETRRYTLADAAARAAVERLALCDEPETRKRHAQFIRSFVIVHERGVMSADRKGGMREIAAALADILAAIEWCKKSPDLFDVGLSIGGSLFWFWNLSSRFAEGRACLRDLLDATRDAPRSVARAKALYAAGGLAFLEGNIESADTLLTQSVETLRSEPKDIERDRWLAYALVILGRIQHDFAEGCALEREAVRLFRESKDMWGQALALNDLGYVRMTQEQSGDARATYSKSLSLWRMLEDSWGLPLTLNNYGSLLANQNEFDDARKAHDEALRYQLDEGDRWGAAESLLYLADLAVKLKDFEEAEACYRESLKLHHAVGRKQPVADCLLGLANLTVERSPLTDERAVYATHLLAVWERDTQQYKFVCTPELLRLSAALKSRVQGKLGPIRYSAAWEDGQKRSVDDVANERAG